MHKFQVKGRANLCFVDLLIVLIRACGTFIFSCKHFSAKIFLKGGWQIHSCYIYVLYEAKRFSENFFLSLSVLCCYSGDVILKGNGFALPHVREQCAETQ